MRVIITTGQQPFWLAAFCPLDRPASLWLGEALCIATWASAEEGAQMGRESGLTTLVIPCRYGRG